MAVLSSKDKKSTKRDPANKREKKMSKNSNGSSSGSSFTAASAIHRKGNRYHSSSDDDSSAEDRCSITSSSAESASGQSTLDSRSFSSLGEDSDDSRDNLSHNRKRKKMRKSTTGDNNAYSDSSLNDRKRGSRSESEKKKKKSATDRSEDGTDIRSERSLLEGIIKTYTEVTQMQNAVARHALKDMRDKKKNKKALKKVRKEEQRMMKLASAKSFERGYPSVTRTLHAVFKCNTLEISSIIRSALRAARVKGSMSDSAIFQMFTENGLSNFEVEQAIGGLSFFSFGRSAPSSSVADRKRLLKQAFGEQHMADADIDAIARANPNIPKTFHEFCDQLKMMMKVVAVIWGKHSILLDGALCVQKHLKGEKEGLYIEQFSSDALTGLKMGHLLDTTLQDFLNILRPLAASYKGDALYIARTKNQLHTFMQRRIDGILDRFEQGVELSLRTPGWFFKHEKNDPSINHPAFNDSTEDAALSDSEAAASSDSDDAASNASSDNDSCSSEIKP
jgi:hypothetical protein